MKVFAIVALLATLTAGHGQAPRKVTCHTVGGVQYCAEHPIGKPPILEEPGEGLASRCRRSLGGTIYKCF